MNNLPKSIQWILTLALMATSFNINAQNKDINYPTYKGLVMCGYQGWFRTGIDGDGSKRGWVHYGKRKKFDTENVTVDLWPDMSEYEKAYKTPFLDKEGNQATVFSSLDKSTTDLHFKWMKEYKISGVFMQRFYGTVKGKESNKESKVILKNALEASAKYNRAIAVMYDLSGLKASDTNVDVLIEDWKQLIDELGIVSDKYKKNYLHHNGKPLVTLWGVGFAERPYDIKKIQLKKFMDFLKNDPKYGGFSIMLGVPTYFRTLTRDSIKDKYLHEIIRQADIVQPWLVGRFKMKALERGIYQKHIAADVKWCKQNNVDYVPTVFPGFSWYNLSKHEGRGDNLNSTPRLKGKFFNTQIEQCIDAGSEMIYVAMFDEIDEGTAIFKCTNTPPVNGTFSDYEGLPSDFYLKETGKVVKKLRKKN